MINEDFLTNRLKNLYAVCIERNEPPYKANWHKKEGVLLSPHDARLVTQLIDDKNKQNAALQAHADNVAEKARAYSITIEYDYSAGEQAEAFTELLTALTDYETFKKK